MGKLKGSSRRNPWNWKPAPPRRFDDDRWDVGVWPSWTAYQDAPEPAALGRMRARRVEQQGRRQRGKLSDKAKENARLWHRDTGQEGVTGNVRVAHAASGRPYGRAGYAAHRQPADLPGLLDQVKAARERIWYVRAVRGAGVSAIRQAKARGVRLTRYAVTVVPARWMVPVDRFNARQVAELLTRKWRPQAQRWMRNLPALSFAAGMIEVAWNRDEKHDLTDWCFHLHLLVYLPCASAEEARKEIAKAFTCRRNERRGVPRARSTKLILDAKGGPRGWLRYVSKGLQLHAIQGRRVPYDVAKGRRRPAVKWQIKDLERLPPIAALYSRLEPNDLMVWSGVQRRGDVLVNARPKS